MIVNVGAVMLGAALFAAPFMGIHLVARVGYAPAAAAADDCAKKIPGSRADVTYRVPG